VPDKSSSGSSDQAFVVFTPSGRQGRVALGTTVVDADRALGADLDSICGGRKGLTPGRRMPCLPQTPAHTPFADAETQNTAFPSFRKKGGRHLFDDWLNATGRQSIASVTVNVL
jgi:hypothetical protein|tara:strand:- start:160 stop:501 length:342 start_codon:yes stop_codon:yes gene_type:complete